jgi:hypothetical protein
MIDRKQDNTDRLGMAETVSSETGTFKTQKGFCEGCVLGASVPGYGISA